MYQKVSTTRPPIKGQAIQCLPTHTDARLAKYCPDDLIVLQIKGGREQADVRGGSVGSHYRSAA